MTTQWIEKRSSEQRHLYIIKNGNMHTAKSRRIWGRAECFLIQERIPYTLYETQYPGHAIELAKQIAKKQQRPAIIAVGGDGTMHEIVNGASANPSALVACIPAGSGNDYVRGVQSIKDIKDILKAAHSGKEIRHIDLGQVEAGGVEQSFVNSIGMGFDASICRSVNQSKWKKRLQTVRLEKFVYIYCLFKLLFTFKRFDAEVIVGGQKKMYKRVWLIAAANQPYFGGGIKISPRSVPNDGKLHAVIVSGLSSFTFLFVFLTVLWGGHLKLKWVDSFACSTISVRSNGEAEIEADGELIGHSYMKAWIKPGGLSMISGRMER